MSERYRPSNGTEGECFHGAWCNNCARDALLNGSKELEECDDGDLCEIVARAMTHSEDDPNYPEEWTYDESGNPCCTAFVPIGEPLPTGRCVKTKDIFEEE